MSDIEDKYIFTTTEESVKEKDWAAGSSSRTDNSDYVVGRGYTKIKYPPALWKIVDETIVNALDHLVRNCGGTSNTVTKISMDYNSDGVVKIYNNGPGIEVVVHKTASEKLNRTVYVPSFIFGILFQGSNRKKSDDNIVGGTNGVGAKIANCMSNEFTVETVDATRGLMFTQTWYDGMKRFDPPIIKKCKSAPYTQISFTPDYAHFGYNTPLTKRDYNDLNDVFKTRMYFASAYAHYTYSKCKVYYNGEIVPIKSIRDIASTFFPTSYNVFTTIKPKKESKDKKDKDKSNDKKDTHCSQYPWELCIVFDSGPVREYSIVNGVLVRSGKHTKFLLDQITEEVKKKLSAEFNSKDVKFTPSQIGSNIIILANTKIGNPSWGGQRKDVLEYNSRKFAPYKINSQIMKTICDQFSDILASQVFNKISTATGRKKAVKRVDKYHGAHFAGTKKSPKCVLMPVEGDSAMKLLENSIATTIGFEYVGVISTRGVIVNVRKKSTVVQVKGAQYINKTAQLEANSFFTDFCEVAGLNPAYKYDKNSPTYAKEMRELRYGHVCAAVDQDLDGKGNILGSLLSMFDYWWPNLLRDGYVQWFSTPIIRAYPPTRGKVLQFYSTPEYERWVQTGELIGDNVGKAAKYSSSYKIRYYKGLGSHDRNEAINMMKNLYKTIVTYRCDDKTAAYFDIYFGTDPDLRKVELSKPSVLLTPETVLQQQLSKEVFCTDHLLTDTNLYQKDNIERKLDHIIDGQNQSGRKIVDGLILAFGATNKEKKVAVLAGFVSEHKNYHHGEDSLSNSITGKGFIGPGGKQLPIIRPLSNFGTRAMGGADASKPRYIYCKLNYDLVHTLFPSKDYPLLDFHFDEGVRGEPKFFAPIIPLAICESTDIPAHGWKITTYARNVYSVIANVRNLIAYDSHMQTGERSLLNAVMPMPPAVYAGSPYAWKGTFRYIRANLYSFGKYHIETNNGVTLLHITELPLRDWTQPYIDALEKKAQLEKTPIIENIENNSNDYNIAITVTLSADAIDRLQDYGDSVFTDGIEEYFKLRSRMNEHLNFMNADNSVKSLNKYEEVFSYWYPIRRDYYIKRVERLLIMYQIQISYYQNIIRYIIDEKIKLAKNSLKIMKEKLAQNKYSKFKTSLVNNPGFIRTEDLFTSICTDGDYDYILKLSEYNKSAESLKKYQASLEEIVLNKNRLEESIKKDSFKGASLWLAELDRLEEIVKEGFRTSWQFGEFNQFTFD